MLLNFKELLNKYYQKYINNKDRYLVLWGGAGSGKSHFAAQKMLYRIIIDAGNNIQHRFLVIRKTASSAGDSCFKLFIDYLEAWEIPYEKIHLRIKVLGSEILFKGVDDPEKLKSIEGITGIWVEEATELLRKDFQQLDLRLRGETNSYKQILMTFNPIGGKLSWVYNMFFAKEKDGATLLHSTYKNNDFLDKEYIKKLEDEEDELAKSIYTLGEWAESKSAIYQKYIVKDIDTTEILKKAGKVYAGVDFGFNDPSVFLLIAEYDQDIYVLNEIYRSKLTNNQFIALIKVMLDGYKEIRELKDISVYCDSAEPARIKEMADPPNYLIAMPAQKSIKDGIDEVKRRQVFVNAICVNTAKELPMYSWKIDKDDNVLDVPNGSNDHTCDALRYAVYTETKKGIILYV